MLESFRCGRCFLAECLCPADPVRCRVELAVVRHSIERHKMSGSGRLIGLALANAEIVDVGGKGSPERHRLDDDQPPGTFVLFPGGAPIGAVASQIRRLIVIDGTWKQARRMRSRIPFVANTPTVSVSAPAPVRRLRDPRYDGELPTAIAAALALEALGEGPAARLLADLYRQMHEILTRPGRGSRRTREFQ